MKDNVKILIGFTAIIFLIFFQLAVTHKFQRDIIENNSQINNVEAPLELMVEQIIAYDGILTNEVQTAILHAQSGNYADLKEHEQRYSDIGQKLDDLLKRDIKILLRQSHRSQKIQNKVLVYNKVIDEYNIKLVDLETRAFTALENQDPEVAYSLIAGKDYDEYKKALLNLYQNWSKIEKEETNLEIVKINQNSEKIVMYGLAFSIVKILVLLGLLMLIRFFLSDQYKLNRLLFQSSRDAIMTLKAPKWNFTSGNNAAFKIFGVKNEKQFDSLGPSDLSPAKQSDGQLSSVKAKKMIEQAMKEGSVFFEWTHKKYKGKPFKANVLLSRIDMRGGAYLQATVRDVSEEKKALKK
jgi:PAS domain S-box-containing protein